MSDPTYPRSSRATTTPNQLGTEAIGTERFPEAYDAFVDAFSDYLVRVEMTEAKLRRMIRRRSVDLNRSLALFEGRRMVGFVLNGLR